ncbi:His Kinase A (phospho-acceptor) domain-containing protein [Ruminococcaceae bacterium YRB3002]|nr:His Kinase A (phospho-acceptor) domain-containing protein [Ruminococcaceae bacterium YRB3002]
MIKTLRIRFTVTAIASVFLVLALLVGGINIFNYRKVVSDSDKVLDMLADNGGQFPEPERKDPPDDRRGKDDSYLVGRDRIESPELAYESRYFSAVVGIDGTVGITDIRKISAVDEDEAKEYASEAAGKTNLAGFIGEYRYRVVPQTDGSMLVIFLDCGASLSNFRSFLKISLIMSAIGLVLVSITVALISGKAIKPVAESYEKQKRFITDAGHEIKTPLAIINADSDVLAMDIGEDNEWIADIKKQTQRLSDLTSDLILLSRMEEGPSSMVVEDVDLTKIMTEQTESFRAVAMTGSKNFTCTVAPDIRVKGDPKALDNLISILLDNAVKYCPDGGSISAGLARESHSAVIEVSNDISGELSDEAVKHLFDRFYRADPSRNQSTGGHGIGLSVAHAIVTAHGGRITAVKKGSGRLVFVANLP